MTLRSMLPLQKLSIKEKKRGKVGGDNPCLNSEYKIPFAQLMVTLLNSEYTV